MIYKERFVFENINDFKPVHIFECGQVFRWVPENRKEDQTIERAGCDDAAYIGFAGGYAARVSFDEGRLIIEASGGDREFWHDYFDLGTDYGVIKETLVKNEPKMKPATEYGCGIRILNQDLFEMIISFIISQNNNIPRIRKNIESLCERYGEEIGSEDGRILYAFPTAETLADAELEDLAALKLGYRAAYIKESARCYLEKGRPCSREDLLGMHGIGPKVANCIMLFGLGDVAAFPVDTWVRHIMNDMYGFSENDTKGMMEFAREKFGNYAGYAQQYLFYYYRDKGL